MKKLSAAAHAYLNDETLIAQRDMWFGRLRALFAGAEDAYNSQKIFTVHGILPRPQNEAYLYTNPEDWVTGLQNNCKPFFYSAAKRIFFSVHQNLCTLQHCPGCGPYIVAPSAVLPACSPCVFIGLPNPAYRKHFLAATPIRTPAKKISPWHRPLRAMGMQISIA